MDRECCQVEEAGHRQEKDTLQEGEGCKGRCDPKRSYEVGEDEPGNQGS